MLSDLAGAVTGEIHYVDAGYGVWAADKMLFGGEVMSGLLDNAIEVTFVISGPWSEPVIEKLDGVKVL